MLVLEPLLKPTLWFNGMCRGYGSTPSEPFPHPWVPAPFPFKGAERLNYLHN
jgi:hypothetical protein